MTRTLVVGGSGGIGGAVIARLVEAGQETISLDRTDGIDACDSDAVTAFVSENEPFDALVHVAGTVGAGGIEEHTVDQWHSILDDNLTSAFVACQAVIPGMRSRSGGAIVLTSSVNGRTGGNRLSGPAYAVAKAGIIGLVRHLARDLASDGIRVNGTAPGPVATAMWDRLSNQERNTLVDAIPLHRVSEPDEIAGAVQYLLSNDAASITGVVLDINGGMWMG